MQQIGGIQLNSKPGTNFAAQYNVPDTGLTQNTTLSKSSPLYNLFQVMFQNKQTDNIGSFANSDIFQQNGLKANPDKQGWIG